MKERILAVERILLGSERPLHIADIIDRLYDRYGITCERKAVMDDIAVLTRFIPICRNRFGYYVQQAKQPGGEL